MVTVLLRLLVQAWVLLGHGLVVFVVGVMLELGVGVVEGVVVVLGVVLVGVVEVEVVEVLVGSGVSSPPVTP